MPDVDILDVFGRLYLEAHQIFEDPLGDPEFTEPKAGLHQEVEKLTGKLQELISLKLVYDQEQLV